MTSNRCCMVGTAVLNPCKGWVQRNSYKDPGIRANAKVASVILIKIFVAEVDCFSVSVKTVLLRRHDVK